MSLSTEGMACERLTLLAPLFRRASLSRGGAPGGHRTCTAPRRRGARGSKPRAIGARGSWSVARTACCRDREALLTDVSANKARRIAYGPLW